MDSNPQTGKLPGMISPGSTHLTRLRRLTALSLICVMAVAGAAQTVVAFNTFGSGNGGFGYNSGTGYQATGTDTTLGSAYEQAFRFTPGVPGSLVSIQLPLSANDLAFAYGLTLRLVEGGAIPSLGSVLETWTLSSPGTILPEVSDPVDAPQSFASVANPTLGTGQSYWLWLAATNSTDTTRVSWNLTDDPALVNSDTAWVSINGGGWSATISSTPAAYRVNVTAIPEPATSVAVLGLLALPLAWLGRRRVRV